MANTTETQTKKTNTTSSNKKLEAQLKEQAKQIEEQSKQIETLMAMLKSNSVHQPTVIKDDISLDEDILVVSLVPNKLNLVGKDGTVLFTFDEMYEEQYIDYASLKEIVSANRQMAKNGRYYIVNDVVVDKLKLKGDYKNILTPEMLKNILNSGVDSAVKLYKLAPKNQKAVIIDVIKDRIFNGENIDLNLLNQLEELSGVKLIGVEDATKIDM